MARMIKRTELTAEIAREALGYEPETGVLRWRIASRNGTPVGAIAGGIDSYGYLSIRLFGTLYRAHNLVWLIECGKFPNGVIDHVDGNKRNNRMSNLRDVSTQMNLQNLKRAKSSSKSGLLGVKKYRSRWIARIMVNRKEIHLGVFDTAELAHAAYLKAKRELHAGCMI